MGVGELKRRKAFWYLFLLYSINRPGRLESGRLFEVGAYSRLGAY